MYLKYSSNFASNDTYEEFRDGRGTGKGLADFEFCFMRVPMRREFLKEQSRGGGISD